MCYPKPGPRCSSHAKKDLKAAQKRLEDDESLESYELLHAAQEVWYSTPQGQMGLRWKIATATDSDQKTFLQGRLDHGIWARQTALSMYREAQESKISAINPKEETDTLVVPSSDNEPAREATVNSDIPNLDPQPSSEQIAASIQEWEAFSDDDLKNIYSGGDCYKLALAMHDVDPQRFELWAATSQVSESGHHLDEAYSAHWFVKDKANNKFIDIYDEYESADKVLEEWPDFKGDATVQYKQMPSREEAVQIMHKDFGAIVSAFNPTWKEETAYTIQRMGLIKPLNE